MTDALERVKSKARAISLLRVVLHLDGGNRHERIIRPALPLHDKPTLLKLLQLDLETHPPSAAIVSLELHAQSAAPQMLVATTFRITPCSTFFPAGFCI